MQPVFVWFRSAFANLPFAFLTGSHSGKNQYPGRTNFSSGDRYLLQWTIARAMALSAGGSSGHPVLPVPVPYARPDLEKYKELLPHRPDHWEGPRKKYSSHRYFPAAQ